MLRNINHTYDCLHAFNEEAMERIVCQEAIHSVSLIALLDGIIHTECQKNKK